MPDHMKSLLAATVTQTDVQVDPTDPRTWWLAQAEQPGKRINVTAQGPDHIMALTGISPRKFHTDPRAHMAAEAAVSAYYGLDGQMLGEDVYDIEAEALGQKMIYGEAMPTIDFRQPLISEKSDLTKLKAPDDWLSRGRVPYMFEIQKMLREMGTTTAFYCAPFSLAVGIRSYPKLIRDMKRDPAFAHELFDRLVDEILPSYLSALVAYSGVQATNGADAWACYPDLSPELMEEWVLPYNARLTGNCQKRGFVATAVAVGDYCEEDLDKFDKEMLFRCLDIQSRNMFGAPFAFMGMGRWQDYPLEAMVEYLERYKARSVRCTLMGGVNARFMRDASPQEIAANVKRLIALFGHDHDLSIFLASTPADTPSQHVHAAVAAAHAYGKLPISAELDDKPVKIPQRESFQEYVHKMSGGRGLPI